MTHQVYAAKFCYSNHLGSRLYIYVYTIHTGDCCQELMTTSTKSKDQTVKMTNWHGNVYYTIPLSYTMANDDTAL